MSKIILKIAEVLEQNKIYTIEGQVDGSTAISYIRWRSTGKTEFKSPRELESKLGDLEIQFNSTTTYKFLNVPREVFEGLFKAESAGKFFNAHIRGKFMYEQLSNPLKKQASVVNADTLKPVTRDLKKKIDDIVLIFSGGIKYVRYNKGYDSMDIEFESGNCFSFKNVSKSIYDGFIESTEKGSFYNKNIKGMDFLPLEKQTLSDFFV